MVVTNEIAEKLADYVFENLIKKSKHKFIAIDDVSTFLKKKLEEEYTSEIGMSVKEALKDHGKVEFFKEGEYVHEQKFHYSTGNWLVLKGTYKNPIEMKNKLGWMSWQLSESDDGAWLD